MIIAMMARPSKCGARCDHLQISNSRYTHYLDRFVLDRLGSAEMSDLWWNVLNELAMRDLNNHRNPGYITRFINTNTRDNVYRFCTFLNENYRDWYAGVVDPSEDDAIEHAQDRVCYGCEYWDDEVGGCIENDRCDAYYEEIDTYMRENRDYNYDMMQDAWEDFDWEMEVPQQTSSRINRHTIGVFTPIRYLDRRFDFSTPCIIEREPTFDDLRTVSADASMHPTIHAMNLWCRMRLAIDPALDHMIDKSLPPSSVWGPRAAATAVLAQDRHQQYMLDNGVGWEVGYGRPSTAQL